MAWGSFGRGSGTSGHLYALWNFLLLCEHVDECCDFIWLKRFAEGWHAVAPVVDLSCDSVFLEAFSYG